MSKRVWLEVALNGGWTRKRQPLIPVSRDELTEEAIRCVNAGAAVIHLHAYVEQHPQISLCYTAHRILSVTALLGQLQKRLWLTHKSVMWAHTLHV